MKFQNCILINFERTHGLTARRMEALTVQFGKFKEPNKGPFGGRTEGQTHGQAQSNMPLQLFQSGGQKNIMSPTHFWVTLQFDQGHQNKFGGWGSDLSS